jgi:hypothetical protein
VITVRLREPSQSLVRQLEAGGREALFQFVRVDLAVAVLVQRREDLVERALVVVDSGDEAVGVERRRAAGAPRRAVTRRARRSIVVYALGCSESMLHSCDRAMPRAIPAVNGFWAIA